MRIVGLTDGTGTVRRAGTAVPVVGRAPASQRAATETREAETPSSASRVSAGTQVPVNHDRVSQIRKALETGTYPLVPAEIADALIAAGLYGMIRK